MKLQSINDLNAKYLIKLNEFKNTPKGMKISKKQEEKIQRLHTLILKVSYYLELE